MAWQRLDGRPVDHAAFQPVFLQCKGDAYAVAANAYPNVYLLAAAEGNRNQTREAVMEGCMGKSTSGESLIIGSLKTATPFQDKP